MAKKMSGIGWSFEPANTRAAPPEVESLQPERQRVTIRLEKRPRGKEATVVAGFVLSSADRKTLTAELKKKCGAGGSETKDGIEIQGDHRDAIRALLSAKGWGVK